MEAAKKGLESTNEMLESHNGMQASQTGLSGCLHELKRVSRQTKCADSRRPCSARVAQRRCDHSSIADAWDVAPLAIMCARELCRGPRQLRSKLFSIPG